MPIISIVGNAESIFDKEYGDLIDSADIVIRFNGGVPICKKSQGTKTDILAFSNILFKDAFKEDLIYWDMKQSPERFYLEKVLGSTPSNGIAVIERVKNAYNFYQIQVFGFDWKASGTFWRKKEHKNPKHDYKKEEEYCKKIIETNKNWKLYQ